jgi:hypothetical protein
MSLALLGPLLICESPFAVHLVSSAFFGAAVPLVAGHDFAGAT